MHGAGPVGITTKDYMLLILSDMQQNFQFLQMAQLYTMQLIVYDYHSGV